MSTTRPIRRVTIIGTGVIGASSAALYLAKGLEVAATDIAPNAEAALKRFVDAAWPALKRLGLAPGASQSNLSFTPKIEAAVSGTDLVQENGDNSIRKPDAYYEPNSFDGPKEKKRYAEPALPLHGSANRHDHRDGNDDYTRAGNLFRLFDADQRQRLFQNIAAAMQGVPDAIKQRQITLIAKCDHAFGAGVAKAVEHRIMAGA
ncbi:MAG TPA: catalase-related domain-containing protein [Candidatus Sulfotelmatobacter sp.]